MTEGWRCPDCKRCYAPSVTMCPECPSDPITIPPTPLERVTFVAACPSCGADVTWTEPDLGPGWWQRRRGSRAAGAVDLSELDSPE